MNSLAGRVAVVTGGGRGIGASIAAMLLHAGARVAVIDLAAPPTAEADDVVEINRFVGDVTDEKQMVECSGRIVKDVGPVEILVNCAAKFQEPRSPSTLTLDRWDKVVSVALRGTYIACRVFGEQMAQGKGGAIVNIASVAGMVSFPYHAYGPAKSGVISLTQSLAAEWGTAGIRVNAVSPGFTLTEQMQQALDRGTNLASAMSRGSALGRLVEPDEVARAVLFLASPAASAITGINLPVDCGWLAGVTWQPYGGLRGQEEDTLWT